ncbi:MAG: Nitrate/nitrite sensor protein (EC [uncultured Thiotrichaceae bacterium]|uniref:Sensor protein n=1 Tax=uncultured Thiotrichaceae bacterium TaxID=298394 RepID=A0A6S6U8N1_9GAMM|nr:MAG: Nitrate/nitrite sensor protein (EC [uncultured Thiotrichaceae bacterium]
MPADTQPIVDFTKRTRTASDDSIQSLKGAIEFPWQARLGLAVLFVIFFTIGATYYWIESAEPDLAWLPWAMTSLWLVAGAGVMILLYWLWREFNQFGTDLAVWVDCLRAGNLSERMPVRRSACPSFQLRNRLNNIAGDYQTIASKLEGRLSRQAKYIQQKKHYLNVLYDVASCINRSQNLEDLLNQFLLTLKDVVNAEAATVRLLDREGQMRLVASIGLSDEVIEKEKIMPAPECLCGKAAESGEIITREGIQRCGLRIGQKFFDNNNIDLIAIPLQYRDKTLGVYNLFVDKKQHPTIDEEHELLMSIGQHLGMAIEKASVDEEAHLLSIMEERTRMAHELHDSLAQTLASLRFKVRLLDDSLRSENDEHIWGELEGLENSIDDANKELRSLITHFRAPIDGKGIVRAVERLAERFRMETSKEVFFYQNWNFPKTPREIEIEAIRIVQEALVNIRKHSEAETVRILMYSSEAGQCSILVEDDGIGLPEQRVEPNQETGEHIGLTVMEERAARINGEILFESEDGEGTLVQLCFTVSPPEVNDIIGDP